MAYISTKPLPGPRQAQFSISKLKCIDVNNVSNVLNTLNNVYSEVKYCKIYLKVL